MRPVFSRVWGTSRRPTRDHHRRRYGDYYGPAAILLAAMLLGPYLFSSVPSTHAPSGATVLEGRFDVIKPVNPRDHLRLPANVTRRVLVCGAGLAGLSAALELAERGYEVVIREATDVVGGRLSTRAVPVAMKGNGTHGPTTVTFAIEHGFHAWFSNYWQFRDIRQRLGINHHFKPWAAVRFLFKGYQPELLESKGSYPFNLLRTVLLSPNLRLLDAMATSLGVPDMVWFDYHKVWGRYDDMTFAEWAKFKHVSKRFYDILLAPPLSVTLNERTGISAAEMLMYMHIYFLADPDADHREVTDEDYCTAVLGPWLRHLKDHHVEVELNRPVKSLHFSTRSRKVFDTTGLSTEEADEEEEDPMRSRGFDHVVLATNLAGVKEILAHTSSHGDAVTSMGLSRLHHQVSKLPIAPPYKVLRAYFDRRLMGPYADDVVLETPDANPVNLIAQYHLLEGESKEWADKTGGSVIEFHLYCWPMDRVEMSGAEEIWEDIRPTVCSQALPEICDRNFTMLGGYAQSSEDFPSYRKGLFRHRPYSNTSSAQYNIKRLHLAGDWLQTAYPSALMERAVSTGREAANAILLQDSVRQVPLRVTPSHGPGLSIMHSLRDPTRGHNGSYAP